MKQLDLQSVIGYCPKCKEWLGSDSVIGNNTCGENILWQNWVYGNIEDLIKVKLISLLIENSFLIS